VGQADEVIYRIEGVDVAGNRAEYGPFFLVEHFIANFIEHDVRILLGNKHILEVQVRNLAEGPYATVTLDLNDEDTGYSPAGWISGSGDFTTLHICSSNDSPSVDECFDSGTFKVNRIVLYDLPSGGRGLLQIEVIAANQGQSEDLLLDAKAIREDTGQSGDDSDRAKITIGLAPSFSGLTDLGVLLLIGLALFVFTLRRKR